MWSVTFDKKGVITNTKDPYNKTRTFTYDADYNLIQTTDEEGINTQYAYESGKLTQLTRSSGTSEEVTWNYIYDEDFPYDSSYRLSSVSNPRGTISYTYTAGDQIQTYQVNSEPAVSYSYYDDGSVKSITQSGENPLTYFYTLNGQKEQVLYPNNSGVDYSYDDQGRLLSIANIKPDSSILSSYSYGYDYDYGTSTYSMKGFRTSMTNHLSQVEKYYFDNLYQLTRVDYPNGDVHQWSYDDIGNRVQQIVTPYGQSQIVTDYTYYQNSQSKNSQLLQSDGVYTYSWDNNGNLETKGSTNYIWDYDDRLTGINSPTASASYVYDYLGSRVSKIANGTESIYLYNDEDIVKETTGGIDTDYLHGIGIDEPVMMDRAGAKYYYFRDGLGSIREMTDSGGTVQNSYNYGAWGKVRNQSVAVPNTYGYTGREFSEDGLYFYRARYLDYGLGRFISEDSIMKIEKPLTIHRFLYGINSPIEFKDPFGLYYNWQTYRKNCNEPPFNISDIRKGIIDFCKIRLNSPKCKAAIQEFDPGLFDCFWDSCYGDKTLTIYCDCNVKECATADPLFNIIRIGRGQYINPHCGTVSSTIAHESVELCGPYIPSASHFGWRKKALDIVGENCYGSRIR